MKTNYISDWTRKCRKCLLYYLGVHRIVEKKENCKRFYIFYKFYYFGCYQQLTHLFIKKIIKYLNKDFKYIKIDTFVTAASQQTSPMKSSKISLYTAVFHSDIFSGVTP